MTHPQYDIGQYLTIYCGLNEGCCFNVKDRQWHEDEWVGVHKVPAGWRYNTGAYGWRKENTISTEAYARVFR